MAQPPATEGASAQVSATLATAGSVPACQTQASPDAERLPERRRKHYASCRRTCSRGTLCSPLLGQRRGGRPVNLNAYDRRSRNVVERTFNHLKNWRGLATRYDK